MAKSLTKTSKKEKVMQTLRDKTDDQLTAEEQDLREAVWKVRLQMTTGQLQDPQRVRRARRDLARIMTIKRERQLEAQKGATGE